MRFPDRLTVLARDRRGGRPVDSIAIILRLFATQKNDYTVGPVITDKEGSAEFTLNDCNFAITRAREMFIMDYHSALLDCRPVVEVSLHPADKIAGMIRQYKSMPNFWGLGFREPDRLMNALQETRNAEYEPASLTVTEEAILSNPLVELLLCRSETAHLGRTDHADQLKQLYNEVLGKGPFPAEECGEARITGSAHGELILYLADIAGLASRGEQGLAALSESDRAKFRRLASAGISTRVPEAATRITSRATPALHTLIEATEQARLLILKALESRLA